MKKSFQMYLVPGATIEKKHRLHRILQSRSFGTFCRPNSLYKSNLRSVVFAVKVLYAIYPIVNIS